MQRGVLILSVILALGAIAAISSRATPAPSSSVAVVAGGQAAGASPSLTFPITNPNPSTSISGPGDWLMEGSNPARTRAIDAGVAPLKSQRYLGVASDAESGSPPVIARGMLLTETAGFLRAFDVVTGQQRWIFSERGSYISPAVAGDRVFIRAESGNKGFVYALDLTTGKQLWAFAPKRLSSPGNGNYGGHLTSPVVVDGVVFVGAGKEVYALDAATGAERWEFSAQDYITSSATIAGGHVYISDFRYVYAIDQASGAMRWSSPITTAFSFSAVAAGGTVLVTNGDGLMALDSATGMKRWDLSIAGEQLIPAAADGARAYVKSTQSLYAIDLATGKQIWTYKDPEYVSLPVVSGGQLIVVNGMSANTMISAIDAATGASAWRKPVSKLATTAPIVAGQTVFVRAADGRVLAFTS